MKYGSIILLSSAALVTGACSSDDSSSGTPTTAATSSTSAGSGGSGGTSAGSSTPAASSSSSSTGGAGSGGSGGAASTSSAGGSAGSGGAGTAGSGGAGTAGSGGSTGGSAGSGGATGGSAGSGGSADGGSTDGGKTEGGGKAGAVATIAALMGGTITGTATFTANGADVTIVVSLDNCPAGVHPMHIHQGTGCAAADQGAHWDPPRGENIGPNGGEITCGADMKGTLTYTRVGTNPDPWTIGGAAATNVIGHPVIVHGVGVGSMLRHGCGVITAQ